MHRRTEPLARRHVLVAAAVGVLVAVSGVAVSGVASSGAASFGTIAHADDDPVGEAPAEPGDDVLVAVGLPPVPPTDVAVAAPPVPPTTVAVAAPPVPLVPVAVAAPPVAPPSAASQVQPQMVSGAPQSADVEQITEVIDDVAATVRAGLALIDSRL